MVKNTKHHKYRHQAPRISLVVISLIFVVFSVPAWAVGEEILEPPLISSWNKNVSNDEIFFIGGGATVPSATVVIYLQHEGGAVRTAEVKTDAKGAWFYTHPEFLRSGKYTIWTQLKLESLVSPPSPQISVEVISAAIQIGKSRISYETTYGSMALIFFAVIVGLLIFSGYHFRQHRHKAGKLSQEIREAETAVKRGFALLKRDLDDELDAIHRARTGQALSQELKQKEAKILKDLALVERYIGKEVYDIEQSGG